MDVAAPAAPSPASLAAANWSQAPASVQRAHESGSFRGRLEVTRGRHALAPLAATVARLPPAGIDVPARLTISAGSVGQVWSRQIGDTRLITRQRLAGPGILAERMGPIECRFGLDVDARGVTYSPSGATLALGRWRMPLPRWAAPRVRARIEDVGDGAVSIHVQIEAPLVGIVLTYGGEIQWEEDGA